MYVHVYVCMYACIHVCTCKDMTSYVSHLDVYLLTFLACHVNAVTVIILLGMIVVLIHLVWASYCPLVGLSVCYQALLPF